MPPFPGLRKEVFSLVPALYMLIGAGATSGPVWAVWTIDLPFVPVNKFDVVFIICPLIGEIATLFTIVLVAQSMLLE